MGHAHVVIQQMQSTASTQILNPQQFEFFKGINFQDVNGVSSLAIDGGLPAGAYRICTIMCKFGPYKARVVADRQPRPTTRVSSCRSPSEERRTPAGELNHVDTDVQVRVS